MKDRRGEFDRFELLEPDRTCQTVETFHKRLKLRGTLVRRQVLYELAFGMHTHCEGYVFEFGTYRAESAVIMAQAIRDSNNLKPLITVDVCNYPTGLFDTAAAMELIQRAELSEYICSVRFEDLGCFQLMASLPVRMVYIDSTHHYEHVRQTLELCSSRLEVSGWLVLHDYKEGEEVVPALNEFLDANPNFAPYSRKYTPYDFSSMVYVQKEK